MRAAMLTLGACALLLNAADETKDNTVVKEIDIKGLNVVRVQGRIMKPTEITSAEELVKAFPDKAAQEKIKKEVNFDRHRLVYFAWSGSGQDKMTPTVQEVGGKKEVTFMFEAGRTRDLKPHFRLFLLGKDVPYKTGQ